MRPTLRHRGFSLTELLVVLVVIGVLLAIAAPSFRNTIENQRIRVASSDLYASLAVVRSEAIKRNASVTLLPVSGGNWASGWRAQHPTASAFIEEHGAVEGVSISGPAAGVTFTGSGRVTAGADVTFTLSGTNNANKRCLYLTLSGRPTVKSC